MTKCNWPVELFPCPSDVMRLLCCLSSIRDHAQRYELTEGYEDFLQLGGSIRKLRILLFESCSFYHSDKLDFEIDIGGYKSDCMNQIQYLSKVSEHLDELLTEWETETSTKIEIGLCKIAAEGDVQVDNFAETFGRQTRKLFGRVINLNTEQTIELDWHTSAAFWNYPTNQPLESETIKTGFGRISYCYRFGTNQPLESETIKTPPTPPMFFRQDTSSDKRPLPPLPLSQEMDMILDELRSAFSLSSYERDCERMLSVPIESLLENFELNKLAYDPFLRLKEIELWSGIEALSLPKNPVNPIAFCKAWESYQKSKSMAEVPTTFADWLTAITELNFDLDLESHPDWQPVESWNDENNESVSAETQASTVNNVPADTPADQPIEVQAIAKTDNLQKDALQAVLDGGFAAVLNQADKLPAKDKYSVVMMKMLHADSRRYEWTLRQWAEHLTASTNTIFQTNAWKHCMSWREQNRNDR